MPDTYASEFGIGSSRVARDLRDIELTEKTISVSAPHLSKPLLKEHVMCVGHH